MGKYLFLIALILGTTYAHADFWENCTTYGGTIITANKYGDDKGGLCNDPSNSNLTNNCNGKKFCKSGNSMNWWSTFVWCETIGGRSADFSSMCPGVQVKSNNTQGACPNLVSVGSGSVWSGTGWDKHTAFAMSLSSGGINDYHNSGYGRTHYYYAFCEE